jgi:hypothetical protein
MPAKFVAAFCLLAVLRMINKCLAFLGTNIMVLRTEHEFYSSGCIDVQMQDMSQL